MEWNPSQGGTVGVMGTVTDVNGNTAARALIPAVTLVGATGATAGATAGAPVVVAGSPPADRWFYAGVTGGIINTTPVALKATGGAGVINYLSALQLYNSAAVASEVEVRSAATVIWRGYLAATTGSVQAVFNPPLQSAANEALNIALVTTATATRVSAQGYTGR